MSLFRLVAGREDCVKFLIRIRGNAPGLRVLKCTVVRPTLLQPRRREGARHGSVDTGQTDNRVMPSPHATPFLEDPFVRPRRVTTIRADRHLSQTHQGSTMKAPTLQVVTSTRRKEQQMRKSSSRHRRVPLRNCQGCEVGLFHLSLIYLLYVESGLSVSLVAHCPPRGHHDTRTEG